MWDDIIYVSLLLAAIAYGKVTRTVSANPEIRKWLSSIGGLAIVLTVSGYHVAHPLASVLIHTLLIKLSPTNAVHWINFAFGFLHLFFFRLCGSNFVPFFSMPPAHTNAVQMIMTLKLMGLAFEVHDSEKQNSDSDILERKYKTVNPSSLDIFHYAFSHAGILTGPYYRFRTFQDMYDLKFWTMADCDKAMLKRISRVPVYVVLFLLSGQLFPLSAVKEDNFYETTGYWYRVFYMTPVFFNFRMRLFSGFILSECSCVMAGLGAYPAKSDPKPGQGPSNLKELEDVKEGDEINFESVHNIDEWGVETVPTMRDALKTWNMTVQWWLVANVYRRLPGISRGLRTVAVMVTSSAWHGVYAGYYLSLGSVPFVLAVEDLYEKILRRRLTASTKLTQAYDLIAWFMRFQWFSYLGMGFQLLRIDATNTFWHSIWYLGHLVLPPFYLIGMFVVKPLAKAIFPTTTADQNSDKKKTN